MGDRDVGAGFRSIIDLRGDQATGAGPGQRLLACFAMSIAMVACAGGVAFADEFDRDTHAYACSLAGSISLDHDMPKAYPLGGALVEADSGTYTGQGTGECERVDANYTDADGTLTPPSQSASKFPVHYVLDGLWSWDYKVGGQCLLDAPKVSFDGDMAVSADNSSLTFSLLSSIKPITTDPATAHTVNEVSIDLALYPDPTLTDATEQTGSGAGRGTYSEALCSGPDELTLSNVQFADSANTDLVTNNTPDVSVPDPLDVGPPVPDTGTAIVQSFSPDPGMTTGELPTWVQELPVFQAVRDAGVPLDAATFYVTNAATIDAVAAGKGSCPVHYACLWQHAHFDGRIFIWNTGSSTGYVNLRDYAFNNITSSWWNRRENDTKLYAWTNGGGDIYCMQPHSYAGLMGWFNDRASTIRLSTIPNSC